MPVPIPILCSLQPTTLDLPTTSEAHNVLRIILLSDLAQPCQVSTVHLLQRCPKERIIGIGRCILQVLAIFYPGRDQRRRRRPHRVCHVLVHRFVGVPVIDVRREDCARAVWWVRGRSSVREDIGLEWLTRINDQYALVVLAQSFAPELRGKQRNGSPSMFHQCFQVGRSPWFRWRTPPELAAYSATLGRRRNNLYKTGRKIKKVKRWREKHLISASLITFRMWEGRSPR